MDLSKYCKDLQLKSNYPSESNESPNLHVEVLDIPGHRFELEYTSRKLKSQDEHMEFWTMVESMRPAVAFTWKPPIISKIRGVGGNAIAQETAPGAFEFSVYNAPPDVVWLKAGDLITLANQTKVYRVMADVNTNQAGAGVVKVNCPIKKRIPAGTVVNGSGAEFTLIKKPGSKPQSYDLKAGTPFISYAKLDFIEFL